MIKATFSEKYHLGEILKNRKGTFTEEYAALCVKREGATVSNVRISKEGILVPVFNNEIECVARVRLYRTKKTSYACIWVNAGEINVCGGGRANGAGYHMPSAAAGSAIRDAGIILSESINGRGGSYIEAALMAIAKETMGFGYSFFIHHSHD